MAELGPLTEEAHRAAGRGIAGVADLLVTIGDLAGLAAEAALQGGLAPEQVVVTYAPEDAVRALRERLGAGDLVLLKGSATARLEAVTRELLANPDGDAPLLPRQGPGWQQVSLRRPGRPTWVEIDLGAVAHNVRLLAGAVGPAVGVMAVLKADAYGHGAARVARTALNNGASWLGVACLGEAADLRRAGITASILSLGYTPPWQAREAVLYDVATTLYAKDLATALGRAAADLGRPARVHVKVDTGMGRLGLSPGEVLPFMRWLRGVPGVVVEGLFTHLATADAADLTDARGQLVAFEGVIAALRAEGLVPPLLHAANSAAALRLPESRYNMVRPGIALVGLNPSAEAPLPEGFRPALAFKCQVAQVKALPAGAPVGYGGAWRAARESRIAVIPVGYADGFRRGPANWGEVLVRGRRAPLVGNVCMDQAMIDVTDIPGVRAGDEVVLIGHQGEEAITADEVAARLGTINYEVVSAILARVPRVV
ncbi:MAG: alanine racemase [Chloroflexi bacterium]|nr:alanine racemase [Chloroflexota bacterium]